MDIANLIGGERSDGRGWFDNRNPADTREVVGRFARGTADDMRAAVSAAHAAFQAWASTPAPVRGGVLFKAAELLDARFDQIAAEMTREEGKTLAEARGEGLGARR